MAERRFDFVVRRKLSALGLSKPFQDRRKVRGIDFLGSLFGPAQRQHRESDLILTVRGEAPHGFKGFSRSFVMVTR